MKNKLIMSALTVGALLFVGQQASAEEITIQPGDTLSALAVKHKTTVDFLVGLNEIENPDLIIAGDKLFTEQSDRPDFFVGDSSSSVILGQPGVATVIMPTAPNPSTPNLSSATLPTEAAAKEEIARRESGGDYNAMNGIYVGRYQLTNSYLNGDYSPENQERVADAYVLERYGSWSAALEFWNQNGYY